MSEAKHTPGPWLIAKTDAAFVYALNDSGYNRFWAHVIGGNLRRGESTTKVETEANARLIASAPDLLDALIKYMNAIDMFDLASKDGINYHGAIGNRLAAEEIAREAIAKATGGAA